jgi:hypothetical protein
MALRYIFSELLQGGLGDACADALEAAGIDPEVAGPAEAEAALCAPGALIAQLGPEAEEFLPGDFPASRYRWTHQAPTRRS